MDRNPARKAAPGANGEPDAGTEDTTSGANVDAPDSEQEVETEWTIMGYLAGDNNLNEEMVLTLQEIHERAEENPFWPRVKILARLDPSGMGLPTQTYVFNTENTIGVDPTQRYYLEDYEVSLPAPAQQNTGNPNALSGFVDWAITQPPHQAVADRYALILSGHGSGSTEDFLLRDDNPVDSLSIDELEQALSAARDFLEQSGGQEQGQGNQRTRKKIDLLGMDCCFMSMVEVCYQIRQHVDYVVGAESMVPDFGWPYHRILKRAEDERHKPGSTGPVSPTELAEYIVEEYIEFYSDYDRTAGRSVDLAAIKLVNPDPESKDTMMDLLARPIHGLAAALVTALDDPASVEQIHLAHLEAQTYKLDQFVDLRDLCSLLMTRVESVATECQAVIDQLDACILLSGCSGFAYQHSYGLSIYFPWAIDRTSLAYKQQSFNADFADPDLTVDQLPFSGQNSVTWAIFLDKYLEATRRGQRTLGYVTDLDYSPASDTNLTTNLSLAIDALVAGLDLPGAQGVARGQIRHAAGFQGDAYSGYLPGEGRYNRSRYNRSRYNRSRYNRSRWPGDREKSVKNFAPVIGKAYWPNQP